MSSSHCYSLPCFTDFFGGWGTQLCVGLLGWISIPMAFVTARRVFSFPFPAWHDDANISVSFIGKRQCWWSKSSRPKRLVALTISSTYMVNSKQLEDRLWMSLLVMVDGNALSEGTTSSWTNTGQCTCTNMCPWWSLQQSLKLDHVTWVNKVLVPWWVASSGSQNWLLDNCLPQQEFKVILKILPTRFENTSCMVLIFDDQWLWQRL